MTRSWPCVTCWITLAKRSDCREGGRALTSTPIDSSRVPVDVQGRHTALPWREAIGARNRLIHGYDFVDLDILWEIVASDLPALIPQIEQVLKLEGSR